MRAGFGQFKDATPEYLQFAAQFGATDILLNTPNLPGIGGRWELSDLVKLRLSVEQWGLTLSALENVPTNFYDHIMLGGPRRDEQIENMIATVRNIARAGIPIFGYNWMPSHVWRTPPKAIRGAAIATAFDYDISKNMPLTHGREYSEEEMWRTSNTGSGSSRRLPKKRVFDSVFIPVTHPSHNSAGFRSCCAASRPTSGSSKSIRAIRTPLNSARARSPR